MTRHQSVKPIGWWITNGPIAKKTVMVIISPPLKRICRMVRRPNVRFVHFAISRFAPMEEIRKKMAVTSPNTATRKAQ